MTENTSAGTTLTSRGRFSGRLRTSSDISASRRTTPSSSGGLVPGLLVLDPGPDRPTHVGTTDLDFSLSVASVEGDTAEYERIETALKAAGYKATDDSFRWRRTEGLGLTVEFFCPAAGDRPAGSLFRPKAAQAPITKHIMGSTRSAIALDAGEAISGAVRESVAFARADVQAALARLAIEFVDAGRVGPRSYARFMASPAVSQDDSDRTARQASGAVRTFAQALDRLP